MSALTIIQSLVVVAKGQLEPTKTRRNQCYLGAPSADEVLRSLDQLLHGTWPV